MVSFPKETLELFPPSPAATAPKGARPQAAGDESLLALAVRLVADVECSNAKISEQVSAARLAADLHARQLEEQALAVLRSRLGPRPPWWLALVAGAEPADLALLFDVPLASLMAAKPLADALRKAESAVVLRLRFLYGEGTASLAAHKSEVGEEANDSAGASTLVVLDAQALETFMTSLEEGSVL